MFVWTKVCRGCYQEIKMKTYSDSVVEASNRSSVVFISTNSCSCYIPADHFNKH